MTEYVAYTPVEGLWEFTRSLTPEEAVHKLEHALVWRRAMRYPIDNPISARPAPAAGAGEQTTNA